MGGVVPGPSHTKHDSRDQTHGGQDEEIVYNVPVQFLGDPGSLAGRDTGVYHDLCLFSSEDDDTQYPLSVSQLAATEDKVVNGDGLDHFVRRRLGIFRVVLLPPDGCTVRVQVGMRAFALDDEFGTLAVSSMSHISSGVECITHLEVGLTVQVLRLNIACAVVGRSGKHNHVGRDLLIVVKAHEITDLDIFPCIFLETCLFWSSLVRVQHTSPELLLRARIGVGAANFISFTGSMG